MAMENENAPTIIGIAFSAAVTLGVIMRQVTKAGIEQWEKRQAREAQRFDDAVKRAVELDQKVESILSQRVTDLTAAVSSLTMRLVDSEARRLELERMIESVKTELYQLRKERTA